MLITLEACWIRLSIVMSPGGRTSTDETWRLFRTCAGTPDGSWLGNKRWCVTFPSGLWNNTNMFRKFPDLLLRLCLLPQQTWLLPSWSLLCMSFPSSRGVTKSLTTSLGSIQIGTLGGSTVYPILLSSTLLQSLTLSSRDPSTRIFLLTRTGPDIFPIHCRSLAAWVTKWSMRWRFQRWFQIHSSSTFWRASKPTIACLTICRFHGGGIGVIVHRSSSSVLFCDFLDICSIFLTFWFTIFTFARLRLFMTFTLFFVNIVYLNYEWMHVF